MMAGRRLRPELMKILVENKCDLNVQSSATGNSALHEIFRLEHYGRISDMNKCIEVIVDKNYESPTLKNKKD